DRHCFSVPIQFSFFATFLLSLPDDLLLPYLDVRCFRRLDKPHLHVDDLPKHSPDHSTTSFHSHHSHFWPFHTLFAFVLNLFLGSYASLFVAKSFSGRGLDHAFLATFLLLMAKHRHCVLTAGLFSHRFPILSF